MIRTFDASEINRVLNHPSVHSQVAYFTPIGELNVQPLVDDCRNVLLTTEGGGVLFAHLGGGVYDAHIQFLPEFRGKHALNAARDAVRWLFTHTEAVAITARIPAYARGSEYIARAVGFRFREKQPRSWPFENGPIDAKLYTLTRKSWGQDGH